MRRLPSVVTLRRRHVVSEFGTFGCPFRCPGVVPVSSRRSETGGNRGVKPNLVLVRCSPPPGVSLSARVFRPERQIGTGSSWPRPGSTGGRGRNPGPSPAAWATRIVPPCATTSIASPSCRRLTSSMKLPTRVANASNDSSPTPARVPRPPARLFLGEGRLDLVHGHAFPGAEAPLAQSRVEPHLQPEPRGEDLGRLPGAREIARSRRRRRSPAPRRADAPVRARRRSAACPSGPASGAARSNRSHRGGRR